MLPPPLTESAPHGSLAEDGDGNLLPVRELRDQSTTPLLIDDGWTVCAGGGTSDVAEDLLNGPLLKESQEDSDPYAHLGTFPPAAGPVSPTRLKPNPAACAFATAEKVLYLFSWENVPTPTFPIQPGLHRAGFLNNFPVLSDWRARLENDPQSYVISYDANKDHVLIMGATDLGAQYGLVSFLRDSDHQDGASPDKDTVTWTPRSVLDYPELLLRLTSSKDLNKPWETNIRPWLNSTVWNRYSHVSNDTQVFASLALSSGYRETVFPELADFLVARHTRFIPRLLSGQTTMGDMSEGPLYPLPPASDELFLDLDLTGLIRDTSTKYGGPITRGIHLTEGIRVDLEPDTELTEPTRLVPIPMEQLHLARTHQCVFYQEWPGDAWDQSLDANVMKHCGTGVPEGVVDENALHWRAERSITLCTHGDCPTVEGEATGGLLIYLDSGGSALDHDGNPKYTLAANGSANTDPYDFMPGHTYMMAIRYRQPEYLSEEDLDELYRDSEGRIAPERYDVPNTKSRASHVIFRADTDMHGKGMQTDAQYLPPTGEDYGWATFVFRIPTPVLAEDLNAGPALTLPQADTHATERDYFLKIQQRGVAEEALVISNLELYDLSETLAYPVMETAGPSCRGLIPEGAPIANPACTMNLVGPSYATYPDHLVVSHPEAPHHAVLDIPYGDHLGRVGGGFYHTVLAPGLWPRVDFTSDGTPFDVLFPDELIVSQNTTRPEYWQPYDVVSVDGKPYLRDGFLGGQLQQLHAILANDAWRGLLDPRLVDHTHAYTEGRGYNRSQGFGQEPASIAERLTALHCRLSIELEAMGYDRGEATVGYVAGEVQQRRDAEVGCHTGLETSLMYYSDGLTAVHNGRVQYNAPHSGGAPWSRGNMDPFEGLELDYRYEDSSVTPTIAAWYYYDDPEFLRELLSPFAKHNLSTVFWMGAFSKDNPYYPHPYDLSRGSHRAQARLAAAFPEDVLGAGTYYNGGFSLTQKNMSPEEQRAWEQVSSDCMWNPRWRHLSLHELSREDTEALGIPCDQHPDLECLESPMYQDANTGRYYGNDAKIGSQESILLLAGGEASVELPLPSADQSTHRYLVRLFAKAEHPAPVVAQAREDGVTLPPATGSLELTLDGTSVESIAVGGTMFTDIDQDILLPGGQSTLSLRVRNTEDTNLILDGLELLVELPNLGYDVIDGQTRPEFPADWDEHELDEGWHYCDDEDWLPPPPPPEEE
ncbi:MAG: hypothetical protein JXX28_17635 [Deltaproteobacteria bacterium]|nr:hypothetical protein [Deltaproteobacteria bacterium]